MIEIFLHFLRVGGGFVLAIFLTNFDEAKVGEYTLPEITQNTEKTLRLFETEVYGAYPKERLNPKVVILEEGDAFSGFAVRKQIELTYERNGRSLTTQLLLYIPNVQIPGSEQGRNVPVVFAYNFDGNHTVTSDTEVTPSVVYDRRVPGRVVPFSESQRASREDRLPVGVLLNEGYAVATMYYGDIDPDNANFQNGFHALYPEYLDRTDSPGSISAWAWGINRVVDYLETEGAVDADRIAVFGFSRLGKAALWAAANDSRIDAVIVDSSGVGGAAPARRDFGETLFLMTYRFPYWFTGRYASYAGRENDLPVDQHQLLALIAPRPVLLSVATRDAWSDPQGEIESAGEVGNEHVEVVIHQGKHEVTSNEWEDYLNFLKLTNK